jgi:hypothetical protein
LDQQELADRSGVSVPTIKRMEAGDGPIRGTYENVVAVVAVIESAGVEFTNGNKPGVQLARQPGDAAKPASYKAIVKAASASKAKPAAKPRSAGRPGKKWAARGRLFDSQRETVMAKKTKKAQAWSKEDVQLLKMLAREKATTATAARKLKRTVRGTYQKAVNLGVRLAGFQRKKKA